MGKSKKGKLPAWANQEFRTVNSRCQVRFVSSITEAHARSYDECGSWEILSTGEIIVYIGISYAEAARKRDAEWAIAHTIAHEYTEAKIAIKLARKNIQRCRPILRLNRFRYLAD